MIKKVKQEILAGGNVSQVIKMGSTVRRETNFWSKSVQDLLLHLEKNNFPYSPRFLEIDKNSREILTFIHGEVGNDPVKSYMRTDEVLIKVAKIMKQFHDLTQDFDKKKGNWQISHPDKSVHEVICHYDFAPYNTVFRDASPVGIIDFDTCGPGPRIWDIAYTLFTFVPLTSYWQGENGNIVHYQKQHRKERHRKIQLFCDSYGIEFSKEILENVIYRIQFLCDFIKQKANEGDLSYINMIDEGHLTHYEKQIKFLKLESYNWI